MNAKILSLLTWEDIREIIDTGDGLLSGTEMDRINYPTPGDFYKDIILRLRAKYQCKPLCEERYLFLVKKAEEATGSKLGKSRDKWNSFLRKMVAHRLVREGYGVCEIGRAMGKDHSSVSCMAKRMDDLLYFPRVYAEENGLYAAFLNAVGE